MIRIEKIDNEKLWNDFLDKNDYLSFLQDYEYGQAEKSLGREVLNLGFIYEKEIVGLCQLIGYRGKRGNGLVVHHGPVTKNDHLKECLLSLLNFLKEKKFHKKYDFLRINPIQTDNEIKEIFKSLGFRLAPTYAVTENFWLKKIDDDKKMLEEMSDGHRKMVVDSLKKPFLEIEIKSDIDSLKIFFDLYQELSKRKNFVPYPQKLIEEEFKIFTQKNKALLFLGKVENSYCSAALIIFSHNIAFYHHSASLPIKEPLNYKLQWTVIQEAKRRGCKFYNFWGIARKSDSNHPWHGLSQFKKGFGGHLINLLPTFDYRFSFKYYLTYWYEKIRRGKL
ncbi:MAG: peptidoglycan bridge formation glycyltransferase FemA/FemB family protein [Patescibacteria group bacterium]|nr:peptidoglycan bridge formation glycyltransferase FemA/FemB family protein [Patescibacteria group bacterium]